MVHILFILIIKPDNWHMAVCVLDFTAAECQLKTFLIAVPFVQNYQAQSDGNENEDKMLYITLHFQHTRVPFQVFASWWFFNEAIGLPRTFLKFNVSFPIPFTYFRSM